MALLTILLYLTLISVLQYVAYPTSFPNVPLAKCNGTIISTAQWNAECPLLCPTIDDVRPIDIVIMGINQESAANRAVLCRRVQLSREYTETWSFSTMASAITKTQLPISISDAFDHVSKKCPLFDCTEQIDYQLSEEYHWASTTTVKKTTIYCSKLRTELTIVGAEEQIRIPPLGWVAHSLGHVILDDYSVAIWDSEQEANDYCPVIDSFGTTCMLYNSSSDMNSSYFCPEAGVAMTNPSPVHFDDCDHEIFVSSEGLHFRAAEKYEGEKRKILVDPITYTDLQVQQLAFEINQMTRYYNRDFCYVRCMLETLYLRNAFQASSWTVFLDKSIRVVNISYIELCTPITGCSLSNVPRYCKEMNAVEVSCSDGHYWWNVSAPFAVPQGNYICDMYLHPNDTVDVVAFLYGHMSYLKVSADGYFTLSYSSAFQASLDYPEVIYINRAVSLVDSIDPTDFSKWLNSSLDYSRQNSIAPGEETSSVDGGHNGFLEWFKDLFSLSGLLHGLGYLFLAIILGVTVYMCILCVVCPRLNQIRETHESSLLTIQAAHPLITNPEDHGPTRL